MGVLSQGVLSVPREIDGVQKKKPTTNLPQYDKTQFKVNYIRLTVNIVKEIYG